MTDCVNVSDGWYKFQYALKMLMKKRTIFQISGKSGRPEARDDPEILANRQCQVTVAVAVAVAVIRQPVFAAPAIPAPGAARD